MAKAKRDVSYQAKLMVDAFGAELALKHAVAGRDGLSARTQEYDYWHAVKRAIELYLPKPPAPPAPTPVERAEKWISLSGLKYRIDTDAEGTFIRLPVDQPAWSH